MHPERLIKLTLAAIGLLGFCALLASPFVPAIGSVAERASVPSSAEPDESGQVELCGARKFTGGHDRP